MIMNSTKMMFMMFMLMSTMMSLSSNNWFGGWMGLEINLMSFIPLMLNKFNYYSSESMMKYFIIQSMGSMIMLMGIILVALKINNQINMLIMCGLMTKLGVAPFHMWIPSVVDGLSWLNCMIMFSWQKVATLMLLSYSINFSIMLLPIIFSLLIGSVGGINQSSLKKILAYSSINNMGWILIAMKSSMTLWINYFLIYSIMIISLMSMLNKMNINYINQCFLTSFNSMNKLFLSIMLFSMGGLPPMLGFLPKWMVIQSMIFNNDYLISIIMVMTSLITLFYYIRISLMMILVNSEKPKIMSIMIDKKIMFSFMLINLLGFMMVMIMKSIN
uniref:NADH-ubiquinone oxidoreductase chain 2 n=1 Tax=Cosmoscarta bispecularis TaxID=798355 RepID=A0A3Q8RZ82_9HEMI|nr:NADH dehydrogenase subunit 2 [Cosmoscarta bispecularis]AZJ53277.1 NADH dehydrogenase subunit 2 [Cosmoscarta bispecularis]